MTVVVGIAGGPNVLGASPWINELPPLFFHDAAAVVVVDGEIRAAIEEERPTRLKHTNGFPTSAVRACIDMVGIAPHEITTFAYFFEETFCDVDFRRITAEFRLSGQPGIRAMLARNIGSILGFSCDPERIAFIRHHDAHSRAALHAASFDEALSVVIDGNGEKDAVSVYDVRSNVQRLLYTLPAALSPGHFYRMVTRLLGFGDFDEYKVMGLAPYGDPSRYRETLDVARVSMEGDLWGLDAGRLPKIAHDIALPQWGPEGVIEQAHMDFAASTQQLLEHTVLKLLEHHQRQTGLHRLCLSGGVAQNCAMNGVIARSDLFKSIYAHPASSDAGTAIGAALEASSELEGKTAFSPFLGRSIAVDGPARAEETALRPWSDWLAWERPHELELHSTVAEAIASGQIVGWARNRAEFGPRALGARSILADPRPVDNWPRINQAIKKRESFRPFAPAVLAEEAETFFELPATTCNLGQMNFVVPVRPNWRGRLGAVVHVDGTARVQVVRRQDNADLWNLINQFRAKTEVGVLLNTSFNNRYEPIVDSPADAVRTFLTTDLDLLVLGPFLVRKTGLPRDAVRYARLRSVKGASVRQEIEMGARRGFVVERAGHRKTITPDLARFLTDQDGDPSIEHLIHSANSADEAGLLDEVWCLWEMRMIDLTGPDG